MCLELWVHCLVVYERPACVAGGGPPRPPPPPRPLGSCGPHPPPVPPAFPLSLLHSRTLAHTLSFVFSPCQPPPAPLGLAALALPFLSLLSVLSLLYLQLPADRVRQVHPVLRAPGPPSTSNQIPLFLGDLPFQACLDGCSVT